MFSLRLYTFIWFYFLLTNAVVLIFLHEISFLLIVLQQHRYHTKSDEFLEKIQMEMSRCLVEKVVKQFLIRPKRTSLFLCMLNSDVTVLCVSAAEHTRRNNAENGSLRSEFRILIHSYFNGNYTGTIVV